MPSDLANALARAGSRLGPFAGRVQWYDEVSSTNDVATLHAEHGTGEGLVVGADAQTAGRGRRGRTWSSPAGAGLYVSVLLRPGPLATPLLTLAAGVALADGILAATGLATTLKWPNDVYVPGGPGIGRKVGGVLAEAGFTASEAAGKPCGAGGLGSPDPAGGPLGRGSAASDRGHHVVLGFGVNVRPGAHAAEAAARATSLEMELGREIDRGLVLAECLVSLASRYDDLQHDRAAAVLRAWREHAMPLLRRPVEWDAGGHVTRGLAVDIDIDGALIVQCGHEMTRVISGDVRWI